MSHLNLQLRSLWTEQSKGRRIPLHDPYSRPYVPSHATLDPEADERPSEYESVPEPHANRKWTDFYLDQGFTPQESMVLAQQILGSFLGRRGALPLEASARKPVSQDRTRMALGALMKREL